MDGTDSGPPGDMERQLRELAPRVLAAVARRCPDFAAAEDAVQDALLAAVTSWPQRGLPRNPGGWLFHVACRRLQDQLAAEQARARREAIAAADAALVVPAPDDDLPPELRDETLQLLFACCHPSLTDASAVALVLRAVGGLTTAAIARAFLVPEATMAQRISRAKQTIAASGQGFRPPVAGERAQRLAAVLHVLYLMFDEGYAQSDGGELLRPELCDEAIRLLRLVHALAPDEPEVAGLLALSLLTDARRAARTDAGGELVPLHEQDRSRWDRARIAEGTAVLEQALRRGAVGIYQVQAAIAALHDEAPSFAATDWAQILALYDLLARFQHNPMVALNRAVALAMVRGPAAGLEALRVLDDEPRLRKGHRLDAVRGHLCEMARDLAAARRHFHAAALRADNGAERRYLLAKAARLDTGA